MRFFKDANFPFLEWRYRAYLLTALMLVLGAGAAVWNGVRGNGWLNYGVDFTGGTVVQIKFKQHVTPEDVRSATEAGGAHGWEISEFGGTDDYLIRIPASAFSQEVGRDAQSLVTRVLSNKYPPADYSVVRTEAVGPKAGADLQMRALLAVLLSFVSTLVYLAFRFEWRFGLAAVAATVHDILITLGFLALTRSEISLATVAAVLTVVGYSLHDTIVVFDRIREDLARPHGGKTFLELMDKAINETLPRTILTASTVLATLLALLVFAGPVIRDFALVLFLGISIGTFSSIFVASPVLYEIEKRWPRKDNKRPARSTEAKRARVGAQV